MGVEAFDDGAGAFQDTIFGFVGGEKVACASGLGTESFASESVPGDMVVGDYWGVVGSEDEILDGSIVGDCEVDFFGARRSDREASSPSVGDLASGDVVDNDIEFNVGDFDGFAELFGDGVDDVDVDAFDFLVFVEFEWSEESVGFDDIISRRGVFDEEEDAENQEERDNNEKKFFGELSRFFLFRFYHKFIIA